MEKPLKHLLATHGVKLKKEYGQNFLTDQNLLEQIAVGAGVTKDVSVLEIGCGAGALTKVLSSYAKKVIGYEIDSTLKPILSQTLSSCDNVELIFKDVMRERVSELEKKFEGDYIMVANLPYYITTPIVMNFLEHATRLKAMVIMVQQEVAERFSAKPSSSDYGAITVGINLRGSANIILFVPREKFTPVPNVDSAVVKINIDNDKYKDIDFNAVREVVKVGFGSRRKMLVNNLMRDFSMDRSTTEEVMSKANLSLTVRGEALSEKEYIKLTEVLREYGKL